MSSSARRERLPWEIMVPPSGRHSCLHQELDHGAVNPDISEHIRPESSSCPCPFRGKRVARNRASKCSRSTSSSGESRSWRPASPCFRTSFSSASRPLGLDTVDVNILLHLALHWWEKENAPHPSKKSLAAAIGVHPRTVQRRIAIMEGAGFITREQRRTDSNTNRTNRYHFDGLVEAATPYAEEALQERSRRRKEDSERLTRRGKPRLEVVSSKDEVL